LSVYISCSIRPFVTSACKNICAICVIHSGLCNCAQPSCGAALQSRPARSAALFLSEQLKAVSSQECPLRGHSGSGEPPHMECSYAQCAITYVSVYKYPGGVEAHKKLFEE
jgi:hypothetical protein